MTREEVVKASCAESLLLPGAHSRGHDRVVEQHRSGHRADASWDGGDPGRPWLDLIEAHVPDEPPPTCSAPTISRLPAATTRMSALRVTSGRSRVRESQSVTVAYSRKSSCASGLPTRFERPTTTASRPESSMPLRLRSWITPCGVHGSRLGRPM